MGNPFKGSAGKNPRQEQTYGKMADAYARYLPQISGASNQSLLSEDAAKLQSAQNVMPGYGQIGLDNAAIQQQIARQNSLGGAQTNVDLLNGVGGQAARDATALSRETNPNYWGVQDNSSRQANNLLNSFNINGLSPGEQNATERAINQGGQGTGNLGLINNTNTLSNALNFGGAFNTKQALMGNAIGTANQTAQSAQNNGINPTQIALGTSQTNTGNYVAPAFAPLGQNQTAMTALAGAQDQANTWQQLQAQSKYKNSAAGMFETNSSACCFIFLEIHNGVLPWYVRVERDRYYASEPLIAAGYKRMAKWLVPLMKKYSAVKHAVNILMVKPLTLYGAHTHKVNNYGHIFWPVKKFWFTVWKMEDK